MPTAKTPRAATKPEEKPTKQPAIKVPKNLAMCADRLYEVRQARFAQQKLVDALEREEAALREHLINNLPKSQASGIAGKIARATIETKVVVQVDSWDKLWAYTVKTYPTNKGVTALLQRRVGDAAVKEMWAANKKVPGCVPLNVPVVSINKL